MFIAKITLENFKGFSGVHTISFNKGINFFVGNNNCGKSTVFEAVEFIKTLNKKSKEDFLNKSSSGEVSVTIEFRGDVEDVINGSDQLKKQYGSYIDDDGEKFITIQRSSRPEKVMQGKKEKTLGLSSVRVRDPKDGRFKNPTGVDSTISALFEAQFVWADTNPSDVADFGSTKICGRLLQRSTGDFFSSNQWTSFQEIHKSTFVDGKDSLSSKVKPLAAKLQRIMTDQYGETEVKFHFTLPDVASFLKTGTISLSDDGIDTSSSSKGTGMQRALALSLIQVYADVLTKLDDEEKTSKPLLFFIDEPETFLHPSAQYKLLNALENISADSQIFVTTHSPYLLKQYAPQNHSLFVFSKNKGSHIEPSTSLNMFGSISPTWGEINFSAFGVVSEEFHNELYGFIQERAIVEDEKNYYPKEFDDYLVAKGLAKNKNYVHLKSDGTTINYLATPQTYIRNVIHHPENTNNMKFSEAELRSSIEAMVSLI